MRSKLLAVIGVGALMVTAVACSNDKAASTTTSQAETPDTTRDAPVPVDPASVAAAPSSGCTGASPVAPGHETITLAGTTGGNADQDERWFYRDIPTGYDTTTPSPVVIDFHGYSEGAEIHYKMSDLSTYGDEQGFVTITPQGSGAVARWDVTLGSEDLAVVGQIIDQVEATVCVDTNRIFVTGLSNGAFMTSAIACQYADRIAAAAPVAGIRDIEGCAPTRPVPVVAFHGTADNFVSFDGSVGSAVASLPAADGSGRTIGEATPKDPVPNGPTVPEITGAWAARNGCEPTPTSETIAADVTLVQFPCPPGADTELYEIAGGGHSWPGSALSVGIESVVGKTTMSISANDLMWAFFQQHPLSD